MQLIFCFIDRQYQQDPENKQKNCKLVPIKQTPQNS